MIDFAIVIASLLITLIWGLRKSDHIKSFRDFAVSDTPFSTPLIMATMFATVIGSASTVGLSEKIFTNGIYFILTALGVVSGYMIISLAIAPRFKHFEGKLSLGDVMYKDYGPSGKLFTGVFGTLYSTGILGAQLSAGGHLFYYLFDISHACGVCIGAFIIILYSYTGGIKSVTFTDAFQFCILIIAIPIIGGMGLKSVGGFKELWSSLPDSHTTIIPTDGFTLIKIISLTLLFAIPRLSPPAAQRLLIARSSDQIKDSVWYVSLLILPFAAAIALIGLTAFHLNPELNPHNTLLYITDQVLPIGIKGLAISGILAVIMSSADSDLNAASISITHDVITPISKKYNLNLNELKVAKWATLIIGITAVIVAISFKSIFDLIVSSLALWVPIIMPLLLGTIFNIRVSRKMFFVVIATGLASYYTWKYIFLAKTGINASLIGFILSSIVLIICRIKPRKDNHHHSSKNSSSSWSLLGLKNRLLQSLSTFSSLKIKDSGAPYFTFSAFAIITYIVPFYIWPYGENIHQSALQWLFFVAAFVSFLLLLKDAWPKFIQKLLPLYWYTSLLYCLPFLTTFLLFATDLSPIALAHLILGVFVLSLLVNWILLLSLIGIGVISAIIYYFTITGSLSNIISEAYIWPSFLYMLSVFAAAIFSRSNEIRTRKKLEFLKMTGGAIAHEVRTPLAIINSCNHAMEQKSIKNELSDDLILQLTSNIRSAFKNANYSIDIFLENLSYNKTLYKEVSSLNDIIQHSIEVYPFVEEEKGLVGVNLSEDFEVTASKHMIRNVIWNLLKNALYQIRLHERGSITVTTQKEGDYVKILIRDTAQGIPKDKQKRVFDLFHTNSEGGTGIGLAFCKNVMEKHDGSIELESEYGEYAEFALSFPIKSSES